MESKIIPQLVAIDVETMDTRGASFEYFRRDFRVFSLSCCWRDESGELQYWFSTDLQKIGQKLYSLAKSGTKIIAHNLSFEQGVMLACFPRIQLNWHADTMRLTQLRDGGGDEFGEPTLTLEQEMEYELGELTDDDVKKLWAKSRGNSLEAASMRFLESSDHEHKKPAHDWLKENKGIEKGFGQYLHLLPHNMLESYNNADTKNTILLYESHTTYFGDIGFDWTRDWVLYLNRSRLMSRAYYEGIIINREELLSYILEVEQEIKEMEAAFIEAVSPWLPKLKRLRLIAYIDKHVASKKTAKGKINHLRGMKAGKYDDLWKTFNPGSSTQLAQLFVNIMGMNCKFHTPKGAPSMKTSHLGQWGEYGLLLQKRKKRLLVLHQACNVYIASGYDGKVHPSVKVAGTRTNRCSGGRDE